MEIPWNYIVVHEYDDQYDDHTVPRCCMVYKYNYKKWK